MSTANDAEAPVSDTPHDENAPPQVTSLLRDLLRDGTIMMQDDDGDEEYIDIDEVLEDGDEEGEEDGEEGEEGEEEFEIDQDEDDELGEFFGYHPINPPPPPPSRRSGREVIEPKQAGLDLLFSGEFGRIQHQIRSHNKAGSVAKHILNRARNIRPLCKEDVVTVGNLILRSVLR